MQVLDRTGVGTLWSICKTKFALAGHTHNSLAAVGNEQISATAYGSGLHFKPYYSSGGPTTYGNILEYTSTNTGGGQLAMEWTGSQTKSDGTDSNVGRVYYRSKRDCINGWTKWMTLAYTNDIPTKLSQLTNDKGFVTGSVSGNTVTINGASTTWTNTWRGIQDNLTSTSTSESLSANQGRILKGLVDCKANSSHTHNYAGSGSAGGSANSAISVVDYGQTSKTIQIGYAGDGITGDQIKFIAGYTDGSGNVNAKIKDVSKYALRSWLGLGSLAYSSATITDNKVTQNAVKSSDYTNWRSLVFSAANSATEGFAPSTTTDGVFIANTLSVQPSSGTIRATKFKGALEGNASTASNASTVNGYTVNANVPSNAKFTDTEYVIPTLSSAPTSSTLTFTDNGVTRSFKVGYMCRVADSSAEHGYKFYQLYDISGNNAVWGEISGGGGDYDETVTVTLTSTVSSSDNKLIGAVVTINDTNNDKTQTQTWNGTPLVFKVPATSIYVISVSNVSGYILPTDKQYTAGVGTSRDVTISYKHIPLGIYIYDTDGNFTKANKWNTANNGKAVGVSVCTENSQFIIGDYHSYYILKDIYGAPSGVVTTTNVTTAKKDYAGKSNTDKIIAEFGKGAQAATFCRNCTFKNGKTGYLWSLGEMVDAMNNKQEIDAAIEKIGGTSLSEVNDTSYWTSTLYNKSYAWKGYWSNGNVYNYDAGETASVRPVCQF